MIVGICPVLAVPFTADGAVDEPGFNRIVEHVLSTGVTAVTLFGLASEFHKLSDLERVQLRSRFLGATRDRPEVTAIVSVTDHATELAVARAQEAEAEGAGAINLLPPHFLRPSPGQLRRHVEAVLTSVAIPVMLQYAPTQTMVTIPAEEFRDLASRHPNLTHVKVETQPPGRFIDALAAGDPPLKGLVGYAGVQMPDALRRGAVGVQPGCSFTELYVELWRRRAAGDDAGYRRLHTAMLPYLTYWMQSVELIIQIEKTILQRRGLIDSDRCRNPGWELDEEEIDMVERFLGEFAEHLLP